MPARFMPTKVSFMPVKTTSNALQWLQLLSNAFYSENGENYSAGQNIWKFS